MAWLRGTGCRCWRCWKRCYSSATPHVCVIIYFTEKPRSPVSGPQSLSTTHHRVSTSLRLRLCWEWEAIKKAIDEVRPSQRERLVVVKRFLTYRTNKAAAHTGNNSQGWNGQRNMCVSFSTSMASQRKISSQFTNCSNLNVLTPWLTILSDITGVVYSVMGEDSWTFRGQLTSMFVNMMNTEIV